VRSTATQAIARTSLADCHLCRLGNEVISSPPTNEFAAVYRDPSAVVFLLTTIRAIGVAPTTHIHSLSELDGRERGAFLAALRRISLRVRRNFGCSETTTSVMDSPLDGCDRHLWFRVLPVYRDEDPFPGHLADPMADAEGWLKNLMTAGRT